MKFHTPPISSTQKRKRRVTEYLYSNQASPYVNGTVLMAKIRVALFPDEYTNRIAFPESSIPFTSRVPSMKCVLASMMLYNKVTHHMKVRRLCITSEIYSPIKPHQCRIH